MDVFMVRDVVPILAARGELEEARRRLEAVRPRADTEEAQARRDYQGDGGDRAPRRRPVARGALCGRGRDLRPRQRGRGARDTRRWVLRLRSRPHFALGDDAKADELLAIVEHLPPGELSPFSARPVPASPPSAQHVHGDGDTAAAGFSAAARILREIEYSFDLAVVLLEHAEWLAGEGAARRGRAARRRGARDLRAAAGDAVPRAARPAAGRGYGACGLSHSAHACS